MAARKTDKQKNTKVAEASIEPELSCTDFEPFARPVFHYKKGGRPRKLHPDESTYRILAGIASFQAKKGEAAAMLGVTHAALSNFFKNNPEALEAWDYGKRAGKFRVRELLHKTAESDPATLRFLAKNTLGMTDGGANTKVDINVTNNLRQEDRLAMIEALQGKVINGKASEVEDAEVVETPRAIDRLIGKG